LPVRRLDRCRGGDPPGVPLAVDLVPIGPEMSGRRAWRAGFAILPPGGFLIGLEAPDAALAQFTWTSGSNVLPLAEPGSAARWAIEKGLNWTG
jgi:hypothetical protein